MSQGLLMPHFKPSKILESSNSIDGNGMAEILLGTKQKKGHNRSTDEEHLWNPKIGFYQFFYKLFGVHYEH